MQTSFARLNSDDQEVFRLYKSNSPFDGQQCFSDYLNRTLLSGSALQPKWEEKANALESIISRAVCADDMIVYRATVDCFVNPFISGNELIYPAFISTAAEEHAVQRHFSGPWRGQIAALLRIHCPTGTAALDLEANEAFGGLEQEFLLSRKSKFKVGSVQDVSDKGCMSTFMGIYTNNYSSLKIYELEHVGKV